MAGYYRGGPYSFRDSLVCARVTALEGTTASIQVKSVFYPVVMAVAGETITATFPDDKAVIVDFEGTGTFTCTFAEDPAVRSPKNDTDSLLVIIA